MVGQATLIAFFVSSVVSVEFVYQFRVGRGDFFGSYFFYRARRLGNVFSHERYCVRAGRGDLPSRTRFRAGCSGLVSPSCFFLGDSGALLEMSSSSVLACSSMSSSV